MAVAAEQATGSEADCLTDIVTRARFAGHAVSELAADAGYASQDAYAALNKLNTAALIPPQPGAKHPAAVAARARMRTPAGRDAALDRQAHAEGAISELKRHGSSRARCRGTRLVELQLLAAATAINLKRLLDHDHTADHAQTGDPGADHAPEPGHIGASAVRHAAIRVLTSALIDILTEIDRLTTADPSTGS